MSAEEVESALMQHAAVPDVAIVALPDPRSPIRDRRFGERARAFIVLKAGTESLQ